MLAVSQSTIRILDGQQEIARHRRSYDHHQSILDPAHQDELLKQKRIPLIFADLARGWLNARRLQQAVKAETDHHASSTNYLIKIRGIRGICGHAFKKLWSLKLDNQILQILKFRYCAHSRPLASLSLSNVLLSHSFI
jgi:hypothetical protein